MYKNIILVIISLFFISCSYKSHLVKPNEKAFAQEDDYIFLALRAEQLSNHKVAAKFFEKLYEKSSKKEYLYRSLENDLVAKEYKKVIQRVDTILENTQVFDAQLIRLKILSLLSLNHLDKAIALSVSLAIKTKKVDDYLLTSDIYVKRQDFDMAVKYLEGAYVKEYNEKILDKMSILLYVNLGRKKDAIAELETHSRIFGCSELICNRLIAFYSNDNNINGMLSAYLRLYDIKKEEKIAKKIVQIYSYKRNYMELISFLEKYNSDDTLLLQIYSSLKNYKKAYILSDKLYNQTLKLDYLGQSAIFEYESASNKENKKLLNSVVKKLTQVTQVVKKPLFMNYLGYILIDHEIDVKRGMDYIHTVLKHQPDSSFYLDSLAWGYYKLGNCHKAKNIMNRVVTLEGGDDPEVVSHVKKINQCLKN